MEEIFDERYGFLVADVGRLSGMRFDDLARPSLNLTRVQFRVLVYLSNYGDMKQASLAEFMEVAPISAGRLLDRMEEGGWIERRPNLQDKRERVVGMTPKAHQALDAACRVGDKVAAEALGGFSKNESEQLVSLLKRIRANLSGVIER